MAALEGATTAVTKHSVAARSVEAERARCIYSFVFFGLRESFEP